MTTNGWRKLTLLVCLMLGSLLAAAAWAKKPGSPLMVTIKTSGKATPGGTATFEVSVTTQMDGELTITLLPPAGATVTSGDLVWRGAVAAHGKKKMSLSIELTQSEEQEFRAVAKVTGPNGERFGATARHVIATKAAKESKEQRTIRNGEEIIELPVPAK